MSPKDLARFGLLVATGGIWRGKRLISSEWICGHAGVGIHLTDGDRETYLSIGRVNTAGFPSLENFKELIIGPVVSSE